MVVGKPILASQMYGGVQPAQNVTSGKTGVEGQSPAFGGPIL